MYDVTFAGNVVRALKRIANLRFTYQLRKTCLANNPRKDQISYLCANNNDMFGNLFKVRRLLKDKHYVSCHGYSHLLYFPWDRSDTMLVSREEFRRDMEKAYETMAPFGIKKKKAYYFVPPFEHFNDTISAWAKEMGLQLINNTYGTLTYGDYTTPDMARYYSSNYIMERTMRIAGEEPHGINGHILLIHFGTSERRTDKFYNRLPQLIENLKKMGYEFADLSKVIPKP